MSWENVTGNSKLIFVGLISIKNIFGIFQHLSLHYAKWNTEQNQPTAASCCVGINQKYRTDLGILNDQNMIPFTTSFFFEIRKERKIPLTHKKIVGTTIHSIKVLVTNYVEQYMYAVVLHKGIVVSVFGSPTL